MLQRDLLELLDYIKVGPYVESLGALDSPTTNQRLYQVIHEGDEIQLIDITYKMQRRNKP